MRRIVVIGGALAGPTAAREARRVDPDAEIILLERSLQPTWAITGLDPRRGPFSDVRAGIEVVAIDPVARTVATDRGVVPWDALIVGTGAESIVPPGLDGVDVVTFRTIDDLATLRDARRVIVLGGGYFGVEAADALAKRGASVVLYEREARILGDFSAEAADAVARSLGVEIHTGASAPVPERGAVVVAAVGVRPRTRLLAQAGAALHPDGSARIDDRCQTSLPGVYACGACVPVPHRVTGRATWLPQASIVDKTARVAGSAAAGGDARLAPVVGTRVLRAGDLTLAATGHGPTTIAFRSPELTIALGVAAGRLVAAEVWGTRGVERRIDVLATAIAGGLSPSDLGGLDLADLADPANEAARA